MIGNRFVEKAVNKLQKNIIKLQWRYLNKQNPL